MRIMLILISLTLSILWLGSYLEKTEQKQNLITLEEAQSNKRTLKCLIKEGNLTNLVTISPHKIQGFSKGTWYFTNGKAKSCNLN